MHPIVYRQFIALCQDLPVSGAVLEIGASPHHPTLLGMPSLQRAASRIGVGLDGDHDGDGYVIRQMNSHDLSAFADASFDLVLSNAMLEHDPRFWLTLGEAYRVLKPGGWMMLGVPGFGGMGTVPGSQLWRQFAGSSQEGRAWSEAVGASSLTLGVHNYPADYYRFSEQAMRDVLLDGLVDLDVSVIMQPPRVIGRGRKPQQAAS